MTKQDLTLIAVVLDRSGSMSGIAADMEGGLNTLIKEQAALPGECRITLAQFDDKYELVADYVDAKLITEPFRLVPRGSTALLDATGKTISSVGSTLKHLPEDKRPGKVIFTIITDGMENASREWSNEQVKALIAQQTKDYGWEFNYLGANQDAVQVGSSMGIINSMSYASTADSVNTSVATASAGITRSRSGGSGDYTQEERDAAMGSSPTP